MTLDLARRAIALWPFMIADIKLVAHRENAVYRVDIKEQGAFALRLHRHDYRSDAELVSELAFMAALEMGGVSVPKPLASRRGAMIEHVDGTQVSVLTWVGGNPLGQSGTPLRLENRLDFFRRFGVLIASMHDIADAWQPPSGFIRKSWDRDGLLGEDPQWGRFWDNPMLQSKEREVLLAARSAISVKLSSGNWDVGLIHADLVSENVMVDGGQINIIDFDDSGFGFRLQDLSTALVKHQQEPDYQELKASLVAGYRSRRPLDVDSIDTFLLIRHLSYVGWIVPRAIGDDGRKRCEFFIADAAARATRWLTDVDQP